MHCYLPQAPLPNRNENHMIRRTTIATLILAAVIGSMAVAISPASAATTDEGDATAESRTANVPVLLSAALPLSDAITAGSATDMKIVGYRFENDGVVGEYFPRGEDPSLFLAQFREDFGMEPRIVSLSPAATGLCGPPSNKVERRPSRRASPKMQAGRPA